MNFQKITSSPLGPLYLVSNDDALLSIESIPTPLFENSKKNNDHPILLQTEIELQEYFQGLRTNFDVHINPQGSSFQLEAWKGLRNIPFGEIRSYSEQAEKMKRPKAARAVGAANGKNPILIIIPCHRVCGADGKLVGFSSGIEIKIKLLEHEGHSIKNGKVIRRK